jgi:polyribonucleotide nucleotidyltransferase
MASVCGNTLSLMDAGVPIKAPVAGVAMGLVKSDDQLRVLTDIAGLEDAMGDMDFKVAGTEKGITALQMDIKVKGITPEIMETALSQAREARRFILGKMLEAIPEVRPELSPFAPRMYRLSIPQEKIGAVIGPGGRVIRSIIEETGCTIDVEDDGTVFIGSPDEEQAQKAISIIESLTKEVELGEIYTGKATRLTSFGAFVEILPGKEGLVRLGDLAEVPVRRPEDVVHIGDEVMVMVIEVDDLGRVNLSRRAVLEGLSLEQAKEVSKQAQFSGPGGRGGRDQDRGQRPPRRDYGGRGGGQGGGRRGGGNGRPRGGGGGGGGGGPYPRSQQRPPNRGGGFRRGPNDAPRSPEGGGFRRDPGDPPPPPPSPPGRRW